MDIKELKRLIELFNNGGDLSDYAKSKLLTFINEQQVLQLLQTGVVMRSEQLSCDTCVFNTHSWSEDYPCATCCGFDKHQAN